GLYTADTVPGDYLVTATMSGAPSASARVHLPKVASVRVTPASDPLFVGQAVQLTATALDAAGKVLPGRAFSWGSNTAAVATVSTTGNVSRVAPGGGTTPAPRGGK